MRLGPLFGALRRRRRPILLGSLGSTAPLSEAWGYDRGLPVDRWYIERFLEGHRADITGRVLEVKDSGYTERYGRDVSASAVLDIDASNERATHVADLAAADSLPSNKFDCFVLTQTLQYVYDLRAALGHAHRVLSRGGVLLVTVPVASRVCEPPLTDYWRFTPLALKRLLEEAFGEGAVTVHAHGNVLAQLAFLKGMAAEDLSPHELAEDDGRFPLTVCARAVKAA
jgi:SAM-dependent methyltransferase